MKYLSKKDLEWLNLPDDGDKRIIHIESNFAIGSDGYRLHALSLEGVPDTVDGLNIKELVIDKFNANKTIDRVKVNVRYLIDALTGMVDEKRPFKTVFLSVAKSVDNDFTVIKIEAAIKTERNNKTAVVMCFKDEDND